ncbi:hypothetical protein K2173_025339 [Erythroxylum novogranatense]|uniref:NAC domain-containing protein n=1 Tax=Erythroxylum novogranatense TaxID=1862640 RepID=A0AAV8UH76_9ROSI|nr:hypothetical protein K2173_025339 [Erythroxylum novogranatense]
MKGKVIGWKKALVFYFGKPPNGEKTSWIMHEYTLRNAPPSSTTGSDDMKLDVWVLCKIHKHTRKSDTKPEQDTSGNKSLSKFQNQSSENSFLERQQPNLMEESSSNYTQVEAPPVLLPEFPGQYEEEKMHLPEFSGQLEEDMLLLDFPEDLSLPEIFYTP